MRSYNIIIVIEKVMPSTQHVLDTTPVHTNQRFAALASGIPAQECFQIFPIRIYVLGGMGY